MHTLVFNSVTLLTLACGSLASFCVTAQSPGESEGTQRMSTVRVEADEDDVTEGTNAYAAKRATSATGLNLSLRDTPQSVTVITRDFMDDFALTSMAQAMALTTGILPQENDTERVNYFSRGYSINNFQIDGLLTPFGDYNKPNPDTAVYDRIEIVRGATGLTTGAGDPSGTINLVRKRPTHDFQASTAVSFGRWDSQRFEGDIGGPLGFDGRLRGRLVASYHQSEAFRDSYEMEKTVAFGTLEFDVTDSTVARVGYEYQDQVPQAATWGTVPYWGWDPVAGAAYVADLPRSTNFSADWSSWPTLMKNAFARVDHAFNDRWALAVAYTHNQRDVDGKMFFGGNGYPRPDGTGVSVWNSYFIGEEESDVINVNINGTFSLFGRDHQIVVGYTSFDRDNRAPVYDWLVPQGYASEAQYLRVPDWRNWTGAVPEFDVVTYDADGDISITRQAAFHAVARVALTDSFKTILGGRYGKFERISQYRSELDAPWTTNSRYENDNIFTPYAGIIYDIGEHVSAYASYTEIFTPQDYVDRDNQPLDPVVGGVYELGAKAELFDEALRLSAAVFESEKDNVAELDDSVPENSLPGGRSAYRSTGKGNKVRSWEVEAAGAITSRWNVLAGFTHSKARNAAGVQINTQQPEDLLRLSTAYRFSGVLENLSIGGGVTWQSDIWRNGSMPVELRANGTFRTVPARIAQSDVTLVNLMAGYRLRESVNIGLNVTNVFDEEYYRNVGFYSGVHWGEPRSYNLSVRWSL